MSTETLPKKKLVSEQDVQNLVRNLTQQIDLFEEVLDLGLRQRFALVNRNLKENQIVNQEQDIIAAKLEQLEKNRIHITKKILIIGEGIDIQDPQNINCDDLYPHMSSEQEGWIEDLRSHLKNKIAKVTQLHNINSVLIQNSFDLNQASLEIMSSLASKADKPQNKIYGDSGKAQIQKKSDFHFVNKKV